MNQTGKLGKSLSLESLDDLRQGKGTFGDAILALKEGRKAARAGWNGKGMWIKLIEGRIIDSPGESDFKSEDGTLTLCSHIDMFSADKKQVVGWLASQTDVLAEDWCVVE